MEKLQSLLETRVCASGENCIRCRNEEKFRKIIERDFGTFDCPKNIPINTPLDKFPQEIIDKHQKSAKTLEENKKRYQEALNAFEELELTSNSEDLKRLQKIREVFFPQTKNHEKCQYFVKEIGEVDEECCNGSIKKVKAFNCSKHTICTDKKCRNCNDFIRKV